MNLNKRNMLIIAGGVALVLVFMYMRSRGKSSGVTDTTGTVSDGQASDYANLAGQIQQQQAQEAGDFAGVTSQESTDLAALQGDLAAQQAAEQGDITKLQGEYDTNAQQQITAFQGQFNSLFPAAAHSIAAIQSGQKKQGAQLTAIQKRLSAKKKTGQPKAKPGAHHTNANHPRGTAGNSVAPRSHGAHRAVTPSAGKHPATHAAPEHPRTPARARPVTSPPRTSMNPPPAAVRGRRPAHPAPPPRKPVRRH